MVKFGSTRQLIKEIVTKQGLAMFEFKDGHVYLLPNHWSYCNCYTEAPRVLVGRLSPKGFDLKFNRFLYLSQPNDYEINSGRETKTTSTNQNKGSRIESRSSRPHQSNLRLSRKSKR